MRHSSSSCRLHSSKGSEISGRKKAIEKGKWKKGKAHSQTKLLLWLGHSSRSASTSCSRRQQHGCMRATRRLYEQQEQRRRQRPTDATNGDQLPSQATCYYISDLHAAAAPSLFLRRLLIPHQFLTGEVDTLPENLTGHLNHHTAKDTCSAVT